MGEAILIFIIIIIMLATALISLVIGAAAGAAGAHRDAKNLRQAETITANALRTDGIYTDVQVVQDAQRSAVPLHYKLSVQFVGTDGLLHRAFIGINSAQELPLAIGGSVRICVFPVPLIKPDERAFDPSRGADGRITDVIRFCAWMGAPIDETGTVMREEDMQQMCDDLRARVKRSMWVHNIMLVVTGITLLLTIGISSFFFTKL